MNTKDIVIAILVIALIVLAGLTYQLYNGVNECKAQAMTLGGQLQDCAAGLEQLEGGLAQCMAGAQTCQDALTALQQIPACAAYIPAQ